VVVVQLLEITQKLLVVEEQVALELLLKMYQWVQ
jgi:hypothetical protein